MRYINETLTKGEKVLYTARFHWMYTADTVFRLVLLMAIGFAIPVGYNFGCLDYLFKTSNTGICGNALFQCHAALGHRKDGLREAIDGIECVSLEIWIPALAIILIGLLQFTQKMIVKLTTEIAVTNLRLVYKTGLIARNARTVNVERVEGADLDQSVLGRIFGYGKVRVRGTGIGDIHLPNIDEPIEFRKALQASAPRGRGD